MAWSTVGEWFVSRCTLGAQQVHSRGTLGAHLVHGLSLTATMTRWQSV